MSMSRAVGAWRVAHVVVVVFVVVLLLPKDAGPEARWAARRSRGGAGVSVWDRPRASPRAVAVLVVLLVSLTSVGVGVGVGDGLPAGLSPRTRSSAGAHLVVAEEALVLLEEEEGEKKKHEVALVYFFSSGAGGEAEAARCLAARSQVGVLAFPKRRAIMLFFWSR